MTRIDDPNYLRGDQYRDATNLAKRTSLHEHFSTNPQGWFAWLADTIDFPDHSRLLEIGSGPGYLWTAQDERFPAGWQVTLSDFSPGMITQARDGLAQSRRAYRFAVLDAQSLPFPSASFDGVIANHMLYHVPNRPQALAEIQRVLVPGGRLFAATNGKNHMRELHDWIVRAVDLSFPNSGTPIKGVSLSFNLENGQDQLRDVFKEVKLIRYFDALEVTSVEPLLAYVQSMVTYRQPLVQKSTGRLCELWQAEIKTRGAVHISKEGGLFVARK